MKIPTSPASGPLPIAPRGTILPVAGLLIGAVVAANWNSFSGPFVFDDIAAIADNPTIRGFGSALTPPHAQGVTVGGRPLLNLSFAINYALSGQAVWSYHALNLLIHGVAALVLFALVRATLQRRAAGGMVDAAATPLALTIAAVWALHPIQTESVTYIVQRAESLMGLFYLVTLYAFARATECHLLNDTSNGVVRVGWLLAAAIACALGMLTKETMVTVPLIVLLYDRTFGAGSFRAAWNRRRGFYCALASTWLIVAWLALGTSGRGGTAGFNTPVSVWSYAITQCEAVVHYLPLVVWPQPLIFDYGITVVRNARDVVLPGMILISLLIATAVALVRRPGWGFVGAFFFIVLAPSSSFVPVASQPIAEHRMYLPLAAVVAALVLGGYAWLGRRSLWFWGVAAVICGILTWQRNEIYRSELALWTDTVNHRPANARAHSNLGNALLAAGRVEEAVLRYEEALRLSLDYADAENNLGRALAQLGRPVEAIPHFEKALRARPNSIEVMTNFGSALAKAGRAREAVAIYERSLQLAPDAIAPRYNLANVLFQIGELPAAAARYAEVVQRDPSHTDARFNLAATLVRLGRILEAIAAYEALLQRVPNDATAHAELANVLAHVARVPEAIPHYETALRLQPNFPAARAELERLRAARAAVKP